MGGGPPAADRLADRSPLRVREKDTGSAGEGHCQDHLHLRMEPCSVLDTIAGMMRSAVRGAACGAARGA